MDHVPQARWINEKIDSEPEPVASISFNDAEGLMHAVRAGLGKSLLPCIIADADPTLRRVKDIFADEARRREVWVLTHPDQRPLARVKAVIDWLEKIFRGRES
jgi:DNA-binding transcriptional LysR family regulator